MTWSTRVALAVLTLAIPVAAQNGTATQVVEIKPASVRVPFKVGERAEYNLKYGIFHAGTAVTEVMPFDTVRGLQTWHTVFRLRGGIPGFRIDDRFESWMDVASLSSLRHWQDLDEGPNERERRYEIFPDKRIFVQGRDLPQPTVELPLDDGSFVYFIRTLKLDSLGKEYAFDRYFRPDRNPVRIVVLRRERVTVPAGTFNTVVVRPIIKTRGVFAEGGRAEVWLTDDTNHLMVQMKTHVSFGTLGLYLRTYRASTKTDSMPKDSL